MVEINHKAKGLNMVLPKGIKDNVSLYSYALNRSPAIKRYIHLRPTIDTSGTHQRVLRVIVLRV